MIDMGGGFAKFIPVEWWGKILHTVAWAGTAIVFTLVQVVYRPDVTPISFLRALLVNLPCAGLIGWYMDEKDFSGATIAITIALFSMIGHYFVDAVMKDGRELQEKGLIRYILELRGRVKGKK